MKKTHVREHEDLQLEKRKTARERAANAVKNEETKIKYRPQRSTIGGASAPTCRPLFSIAFFSLGTLW